MAVLLALGALACTVAAPLPHARTTTLPKSIIGHAEDGVPDFIVNDMIGIDLLCASVSMFCDMLLEDCRDNYKLLFEEPLGDADKCFRTWAAYHFFEDYDPYFSYDTNY